MTQRLRNQPLASRGWRSRFTITILLALTAATAQADWNDPRFIGYQQRLQARRDYATRIRAEYATMRPPARMWTARQVPFNPGLPFGNAIEAFRVLQPPIISRPRRVIIIDVDQDRCLAGDY